MKFKKDLQYYKFCLYGFLKNLKFFEAFFLIFLIEKGISYFQIGILYSVRELTTNFLEIPAGFGADIFGRRKSMIFSFIFYIISFLFFSFGNFFHIFLIGMLFFSFGEAFRTGTHKAMIFEYLKKNGWESEKIEYYGHTRSWSQKGSAISSLIGAAILFFCKDYGKIFLFSIIPYILDLFLMITYPGYLDGNIGNNKNYKENFKKIINEFKISFSNIRVIRDVSNLSLYSGFYKGLKDYIQPLIKNMVILSPFLLTYSGKERVAIIIGVIYFFIYLITSFVSKKSGYVCSKFKKNSIFLNITFLFGILSGLISGILYMKKMAYFSILFYIFIYIIENLRKPAGIGYVSDLFKDEILATALSAQSQLKTIYTSIIAMLLGIIADHYGVGGAIISISFILLLIFPIIFIKESQA